MLMMLVGAAVLAVLVGALAWFLVPTVRTFGGPDFEPVPKDDPSVHHAVHAGVLDGGR